MGSAVIKLTLMAGLLGLGLVAAGCIVAPPPHHDRHGHGYREPAPVVQPYCPAPRPNLYPPPFHR